jgi:hypothetical protein
MAESVVGLHRVLFEEVAVIAQFSAFVAPSRLRRPAATHVMEAIIDEVGHRKHLLMPKS